MEAVPYEGYEFSHWAGDLTETDASCTVTITGDMLITAVYVENNTDTSTDTETDTSTDTDTEPYID